MFYPPFISNKTEQCSFKSGCVVQVENDEIRCQLQSSKTNVRISHLYSSKRRFSCPLLVTRWTALVLKVGVSHGWRSI